MRSVISMSWRFMRANWYWYLLVSVGFAVFFVITTQSAAVGSLIGAAYLCWPIYRTFLGLPVFDAPVKGAAGAATRPGARRMRVARRYVWIVIFVFGLLPFLATFFAAIAFALLDQPLFQRLIAPPLGGIYALGLTIAIVLLVLPVYGTALPAAVIGDRIGPRATLGRARRSFWTVLWRLIAGPGVLGTIAFVLSLVLFLALDFVFGVFLRLAPSLLPPGVSARTAQGFGAELAGASATLLALSIAATLAIAVLCRAYLDTAAPASVPQPADAPDTAVTP